MSDAPRDQQQDIQAAAQAQQNEARMHAHLAQYTRALHDYTLALWTESRRVAQEKEKGLHGRHTAVPGSTGLPATSRQPVSTPTQHHHATLRPAAGAQSPMATQSLVDDTTPKAVTPPKSNPVDSAPQIPTPRPASS